MRTHLTLSLLAISISGCATTEHTETVSLQPANEAAVIASSDDDTLDWQAGPRVPL